MTKTILKASAVCCGVVLVGAITVLNAIVANDLKKVCKIIVEK